MEENLRNKENNVQLKLMDKMSYAIGSTGFCIMFMTISMFLLYTYTDVFFISPAVAASIFLYTRFWDAINDPIMGVIVDKRPFAKKRKRRLPSVAAHLHPVPGNYLRLLLHNAELYNQRHGQNHVGGSFLYPLHHGSDSRSGSVRKHVQRSYNQYSGARTSWFLP